MLELNDFKWRLVLYNSYTVSKFVAETVFVLHTKYQVAFYLQMIL